MALGRKTKKETVSTWQSEGEFKPIDEERTIWLYHHVRHANPSNIKFSQIASILKVENIGIEVTPCDDQTHHHFLLESFFYNNTALLSHLINKQKTSEKQQQMISELEQFLKEPEVKKGVVHPFAYKFKPDESIYAIDENTWTKRLVGSLCHYLPDDEVQYTAETKDFRVNFATYSMISEGSVSGHLPVSIFRGTPDIIIKRIPILIPKNNDDSDDDRDDESPPMSISADMISLGDSDSFIGELAKQQGQMNVVMHNLPEEIGELIANMWWIATAKVVKRALKKKEIDKIEVNGFLIDKPHGSIHVKMIFQLNYQLHTLTVLSTTNGILSSDVLCKLFQS